MNKQYRYNTNTTRESIIAAQEKPKQPNKAMLQQSVTITPLLDSKVQFGKLNNCHLSLVMKEIESRDIIITEINPKKVGIRLLVNLIKQDEYPL